jgi:LPXTG-motif cell wall-anchored protein
VTAQSGADQTSTQSAYSNAAGESALLPATGAQDNAWPLALGGLTLLGLGGAVLLRRRFSVD